MLNNFKHHINSLPTYKGTLEESLQLLTYCDDTDHLGIGCELAQLEGRVQAFLQGLEGLWQRLSRKNQLGYNTYHGLIQLVRRSLANSQSRSFKVCAIFNSLQLTGHDVTKTRMRINITNIKLEFFSQDNVSICKHKKLQ